MGSGDCLVDCDCSVCARIRMLREQGNGESISFTKHDNYSVRCSDVFDSLPPHGLKAARLLCPWNSPVPAADTAAAKLLQSRPTLCDPIGSSPLGSPVPGILQARTLEWVAISFANAGKWKVKGKSLSHARLFSTLWTAAHQASLSMGFSGKSAGVGCHCLLRL